MSPVRFASSVKGDRERRVFSSRRQRPLPPPWRQGLEGALMTLLGVGLLAFLVWLPERMDALVIVSEAIFQLIEGVKQLVAALLGFGSLLLIAAMLLAGLISLLGGIVRLVRATVRTLKTPPRRPRRRLPVEKRRAAVPRR